MPLLQAYVNGANKTRAESVDRTISGFPSFTVTEVKTMQGPLGYLAFGGIHCADTGKKFGVYASISVGIFSEAMSLNHCFTFVIIIIIIINSFYLFLLLLLVVMVVVVLLFLLHHNSFLRLNSSWLTGL